jgi:hypothetical protein
MAGYTGGNSNRAFRAAEVNTAERFSSPRRTIIRTIEPLALHTFVGRIARFLIASHFHKYTRRGLVKDSLHEWHQSS